MLTGHGERKPLTKKLAIVIGLSACLATSLFAAEDRVLEFPSDYREIFTLYYTGGRLFEDEQTIRIYANDIALTGAQSDGRLPEGSVLVAELLCGPDRRRGRGH